ncbi:glycosyltransferase family 2 protein [Elizabethkingia anophelis]|nr:glycosyltransferase family 2 protein [Elizabethkingia anophelis]MCT4063839.1 glycosyltransferase family 2 protein [Elizabethkingia anophelis]MCT4110117.1 glycosyltransferase family 2 protein [Elizabethkingia anophelis]
MKKLDNMQGQPLISVIVPVYNAENTLHVAIDSLINQSYKSIELIVVNDCSKDNTHNVLLQYKAKLAASIGISMKIINHEANQGVAAARNTGLNNVTGNYIYYVDADDFIDKNAIELMVDEIIKTDSDIVGCNWYLSFNQNERKMNQPSFVSPSEAIQKMLNGKMRWNLWLFMARRSLYEEYNIRFLDGMNMGEDMMVMIKLFTHAEKVAYIGRALYHYGKSNEDSLTKTYSDKHRKEVATNLYAVEKYLQKSIYSKEIGKGVSFLKLNIKLPLLISDKKDSYRKWIEWFPEVNSLVMENKNLPFRTRLLQWMAVKKQYWFLKLYYNIVIRYIYGIIYK